MITIRDEDAARVAPVARAVRQFNTSRITEDELLQEAWEALEPWLPGRRDHAAEVLAVLARSGAPLNVLTFAVWAAGPDAVGSLDPEIDEVLAEAAGELELPEGVGSLALTVAWHRPLPASFVGALSAWGETALLSQIALRDGLRESDPERVLSQVAEAAERGCIGPLRTASELDPGVLTPVEGVAALGHFDLDALRREGRWGTLTAGAAIAASRGASDVALAWSAAVDPSRLAAPSERDVAADHGWGCDAVCTMVSGKVLGVLSAVDLVCGDVTRAVQRAELLGGLVPEGWTTAADLALARWVLAQAAAPTTQTALLDSMPPGPWWLDSLEGLGPPLRLRGGPKGIRVLAR